MAYTQMTLDGKQDWNDQPSYQGGSPASLTALQESVWRLVTSVTSGRSIGGLLASLGPNGSWLKMYGDCLQAKMDGSFEEYCETLPNWGLMLDGQLIQPLGLEPSIDESGFSLLPTPMASDGIAWTKTKASDIQMCILKTQMRGSMLRLSYLWMYNGYSPIQYAEYAEMMMGFPRGWADLAV